LDSVTIPVLIPLQVLSVPQDESSPFLYEYMFPIIVFLFVSRFIFLRIMYTIPITSFFPKIEAKHEKEFWSSVFYVFGDRFICFDWRIYNWI